jgi:DNA-binding GntR family transcriptional regulator
VFTVTSIAFDRTSPVPLYYQVAQVLEQAIESGELGAGTLLGNEVELAKQLRLSRPTMRRAIQYLVDRGLLVRKRGVGTQVVHPKVRRPLELTSLYDVLVNEGREPTTQVLSLQTVPASDSIAHELNLTEGASVDALERLRLAQGEPLALMYNYLPAGLVKLGADDLVDNGLYQLMRNVGIRPHLASQTIGARAATAAEARLLKEPKHAPLLVMQRTTYDDGGRAIEYAHHVYRASAYSFEFVLSTR